MPLASFEQLCHSASTVPQHGLAHLLAAGAADPDLSQGLPRRADPRLARGADEEAVVLVLRALRAWVERLRLPCPEGTFRYDRAGLCGSFVSARSPFSLWSTRNALHEYTPW